MQLFALGLNYQTAPVAVRERVAFGSEVLPRALYDLVHHRPVGEAAIVSTCNRTEIYCATSAPTAVVEWLAQFHQLPTTELNPYLYQFTQPEAVKHAFRVASGLDSMVLGETQILGQFKDAVENARHAGTLGVLLDKLFQRTFSVAREVRTQTDIGANSVSMAAAAVRLAQRIFPSLREQSVLFIGAGEMIELCAAHFVAQQPKAVTVANRTLERGLELIERLQQPHPSLRAQAITLNQLPEYLASHDIIITSTASPLPILGKGMVERALKRRRHQPMFMVDLAVPRDIEAEVAALDDVFLYSVDDLAGVVQEGRAARQQAVSQAETIIATQVSDFLNWLDTRELVPLIRGLRDHAERLRRHELERALRLLAKGEDQQRVLENFSFGLTNKFLHYPTHALNHASRDERPQLATTINQLYQLHLPE